MRRPLAALLTLAAVAAATGQSRPDRLRPGTSASALTSLQRLVRHFDFEELADRPTPMPDHFYRVGAATGDPDGDVHGGGAYGFPPFGEMMLVDGVAASGTGSFSFRLDGGSMAARIPTAVIPVMPNRRYLVRTMVRTEGLTHAAARLEAWLHDADGGVIRASRATSRLVRTGGAWDALAVEVTTHEDAADLVVELQLLQPRQLGAVAEGRPVMEDRRGRAWFDDLTVWNVPRIAVDTPAAGNVIRAADDAMLRVVVRDLAADRLRGEIVIRNVDGRIAHASRFEPGAHARPHVVDLSHLAAGWYESQVELSEGGTIVARRRTRLHLTADLSTRPSMAPTPGTGRPTHPADPMFGVVLTGAGPVDATLVEAVGAGTAVVTIGDVPSELADDAGSVPVIERLLHDRVQVAVAVRGSAVETPTLEVDEVVQRFGHQVRRWQLGTTDDLAHGAVTSVTPAWLDTLADAWPAGRGGMTVLRPWSAEFETETPAARTGLHLGVSYAVAPEAIASLVPAWSRPDVELLVTLEQPPATLYAPRAQVVDLALRTLHAWRAGLPRLLVAAPWTRAAGTERTAPPEPTPAFGAWRTLADRLAGRHFVTELPMGEAIHAWLIERDGGRDAAIVAWTDDAAQGDHLHLNLGAHRIRTVDLYGNTREVIRHVDRHLVALTETPLFIEGIDPSLARFRAAFTIDPRPVESAHRVQQHALILTNPWNVPLTGSARVADGDRWRADLSESQFRIEPGGTLRLPVSITPRRNVLAGPKTLRCDLHMQSDQTYRISATTTIDVGLEHLEIVPRWRMETTDGQRRLRVEVSVRNIGDRVSNVEAFLFAPGMSIERRPIGRLAPGQTAVRSFPVDAAAAGGAGAIAYIGVDEIDGSARLTRAVRLPQVAARGGLAVH